MTATEAAAIRCGQRVRDDDGVEYVLDAYADGIYYLEGRKGREVRATESDLLARYEVAA